MDKKTADFIYGTYFSKNHKILGSGYEVQRNNLFLPQQHVLLEENNKLILFFCKSHARAPYNTFFSNLLLFDESLQDRAKLMIEEYFRNNRYDSFIFTVEDYLSAELNFINQLNVKLDHVAARMINNDIRKVSAPVACNNLIIEPFAIGKDEARFVDIFNKTFVKLCQPTTIEEVEKWTQSPRFNSDCYLFAVKDGLTVGFIAIEIDADNATSYLQEIGVIQEQRGKGVADQLIYAGFNSVSAKGIAKMGVGFLQQNRRARRFFSKWDFQELYHRIFIRSRP